MANCTPWYYPMDATFDPSEDRNLILCDASAAIEFERHFSAANCAKCKADCDWTEYTTELVSTNLNAETLCSFAAEKSGLFDPLEDMKTSFEETQGVIFTLFNEILERGRNETIYFKSPNFNDTEWFQQYVGEYCVKNLADEDLMLVFSIGLPYASIVEKTQKVSFSDRLGIIGGTIGLFTGMSLISIVEALFWISKALFGGLMKSGCLSRRTKRRKVRG